MSRRSHLSGVAPEGRIEYRQQDFQELSTGTVLRSTLLPRSLAEDVELIQRRPSGEREARVLGSLPGPAPVPGPDDPHLFREAGNVLPHANRPQAGLLPAVAVG